MTDYALEALKRKRAEITGEIARCHASLTKLSDDLEHLDATLLLFAPDFVAESILPKVFTPPKSWSKRGEMSRAVLSILRMDSEPNIRNKISRGKFTAVFLVQCLEAIGASSLRLSD